MEPPLQKPRTRLAILQTKKESKKEVIHIEHYISGSTENVLKNHSTYRLCDVITMLTCDDPPTIENAENFTLLHGTEVGSQAIYACLPGYEMKGEPAIVCQTNQQWSTPPRCQRIRCGNPPQIQNGVRRVYGHYLNDRTKYRCHTGYLMVGDEFIYCETNGHWTVPPECDVITCEMPSTPDNAGLVFMTGTQFGQTATYQCLPGYTTDDPTYITCQLNGEWSCALNCTLSPIVEGVSAALFAAEVNCGPPPVVDNSKRQVSGHSYNDTVRYECDVGYEMTGDDTIVCQETGYWTVHPDCEVLTCDDPPTIENAENFTLLHGIEIGSRAIYACLPGYEMSGEPAIDCQTNQQWSTPPTCQRIRCGNPPQIQNGVRRVYGHYLNDRTKYRCHTGYLMVGVEFISCETNGHWTVPPECDVITCATPPTPDNAGLVSMTGTQLGQTATYQCLPGYTTDDPKFITCQLNGEWSHAPNCTLSPILKEVNCGPPPVVEKSKRQVSGHSYNDTVRYECDVGYEMIGDDTIVCQETGYWTLHPDCEVLTCDDPPTVENAENFTLLCGIEVGSQAIYACLPGYEMSGEPTIDCQTNQQWSTPPTCQRIRCGNPPQIQNGVRRVYGHYLNDRTKYHCHTGYLMVGDEFIYCETNGHWTVPPECDVITCEMPPTPDNAGLVSLTGTQFGQTATYQCLPGYTTDDPKFITCQLSGEWSRAPNCTLSPIVEGASAALFVAEVNCGPPPIVDNSKRQVSGHSYNDTVRYECDVGYEMTGDDTIVCQETGYWTMLPDCEEVTCKIPPTPDNASLISMTGTQFGQTATYQCLPGYTTDDSTYITCQLNGEWSRAPNCTLSLIVKVLTCEDPPTIENAQNVTVLHGMEVGSQAIYACLPGYEMSGESTIDCQTNQQWSTPPRCQKVNCGPPPVVDNSKRQVSGHSYNDTVRYECDVGYEMTGDDNIVCQETGYWTVHPDCEVISCGMPLTPDNAGLVSMTGTQFGQTATYQCLPGYTTDDPTYITCQLNGEWSRAPNCTLSPIVEATAAMFVAEVNCGPPPVVDNSKRQVSGQSYNDTVRYECDVGYEMTGDDTIVCQDTGYWTVHPDCEVLSCGLLPEVENGVVTPLTDTTVRSQARYVCISGYEMLGEPVVECQTNQQWSTPPQCHNCGNCFIEVNCGPPPVVDNSKRQVSGHSYNDTVRYECDDGYEMTGDDTIVCQETGYWTVHPDCEEVTCGVPPTLDNAGLVSLTGTQFGQAATYQCLPGYTTDDPLYIICQLNGEWSHLPNCTQSLLKVKEVNCGPPPVLDSSKRQISGHSYNDTVRYKCDDGYEMTGYDTIVCQETGYWTVHPDCEEVACGVPPTLDNAGLVSMTGTQFGQTATYQCLPGYSTDDLLVPDWGSVYQTADQCTRLGIRVPDWGSEYKIGDQSTRLGIRVQDWGSVYQTGDQSTRLGISVLDWGSVYQTEDQCTRLGISVLEWGSEYQTGDQCTRLGISVPDWGSEYQTGDQCTRLGISVPDWGSEYQTGDQCTRLGISVPDWGSVYQTGDQCTRMGISVPDWGSVYQTGDQCIRLRISVPDWGSVYQTGDQCTRMGIRVPDWGSVYQTGDQCTRLGISVPDWGSEYQTGDQCTRLGISVPDWGSEYQTGDQCTRLGINVPDWGSVYQTGDQCIRLRISVPDWGSVYQTGDQSTRMGISVPDWGSVVPDWGSEYQTGDQCTRLGISVPDWGSVYQTGDQCIRLRISVPDWGSVYQTGDQCTRMGISVPDWGLVYQTGDQCTRLRISVPGLGSVYQAGDQCTRLGTSILDWGSEYQTGDQSTRLGIRVPDWGSEYKTGNQCTRLGIRVPDWGSVY
ncbi:sushi, von Willebrand factor type A, EGF and pentraxin domain-containing protein 1-like [Watersipora subatra]|uniref:sushi, von Willebrand factor type A, EGF and pentraxin domain-containing protein 1-like n=1 Tax=Watersipora subatra TaxID=2589382 RepID=UPI00355BFB68